MTRETVVLVTGAGGEMGHGLVEMLAERGAKIVAVDLKEPGADVKRRSVATYAADVSKKEQLAPAFADHDGGCADHDVLDSPDSSAL